ncbi:TetR/AcrR family transcriptional regulator [Chloroflexota bacterium]
MPAQTTRLGKQHLLEVAEGLFTEHGYQAVTIREIAQASGVTNAALYYHFPNKKALFDEAIEYHTDKLAQQMEKAGNQVADTRGKLMAILGEYAKQVSDRRSPLFSLRRKPGIAHPEHVQKQHAHHVKRMLAPLERTLQNAVEQGELRQLPNEYSPASLLLGLFHGMLQHLKHSNELQISNEDIELVIDIYWGGLKQ